MYMFLKSGDIAYTGILIALGVVFVMLGGYFEGSTLFFLAAAAFLAGVAAHNASMVCAVLFTVGTVFLGLILAPQKLYMATFAAFCIYVLLAEGLEQRLHVSSGGGQRDENGFFGKQKEDTGFIRERKGSMAPGRKKKAVCWGIKAAAYHLLLIGSLLFMKEFFGLDALFGEQLLKVKKNYEIVFWCVCLIGAEVLWLIFDRAYFYFISRYGKHLRPRV